VTADDKTKVYGESNPAFTAAFAGLVNGDTAAVVSGMTCTVADGGRDAGTHQISCSGGTASDYTLTYVPGTLTVTPAPLTITADNKTRPFGVANPAFTYTVSGLQAGDQVSALSAQPICITSATATSPVGTYPINCTGAASPNYTINYVAGTLSVTQGSTSTTPANVETALGAPTVTLTAKVAADGIPVQEGTVTFTVTWGPHSLTTDAVAVVNGTAQVTVKLDGVGTGTWQDQAVYTASPNYTGSSGTSTLNGSPKGSLKP
jgi:hypothetical protein